MIEIVMLVWLHFFADFVLQTDKVAINKSSSSVYLLLHCMIYAAPFILIFGLGFSLIAGALHFVVDFGTSRLTTYLWRKEERHWFFVTIGFDQAIHLTCLILALIYLK